ncbi:hypothetical protein D3C84_522770 [compost metagenome]
MVFVTQDVGQDGELLAFFNQAHGDTGNRCLHRHTGVHQGQGGAADGSHGAGTVGFGDLGHYADGVGELVAFGQHGGNATTGQAAVADFAATGAAHTTALTDREGREVVVQHEGVLALAFQGVQQLGVAGGAEGGNHQGLSFATGEQGGTVGLAEHADLDLQRTHGAGVATVDTRLAVDDVFANGAVFQQAEGVLHFTSRELAGFFAGEASDDLVTQLVQTAVAVLLDGDGVGLGDGLAELGLDGAEQGGVFGRGGPVPGRLAGFGGEFLDGVDHGLEFLVGEEHATQHLVFGQLLGFGFNHQHRVLGTGNHHVQARSLELFVVGVQQVAGLFVVGHASGADRAGEGNAGDGQGSRGTDHGGDVRIGLLVGGDHGADDLHFVEEAFREQRADRAINQARGQGFLLGRTAFTLEETTGDTAGSVGFFLVVHGQREEALARIGLLGADHGHQHGDVFVHGDQNCTGSLTGDAASLEGYGRLTELEFLDYRVHGVFLLCVALGEIGGVAGVGPGAIPEKA